MPKDPVNPTEPVTAAAPSTLISVGEAAAIVGVHITTIKSWEQQGRVTSLRTPGGHRRYRRADVLALLSAEASA